MERRWNLIGWGILAAVFLGMSIYLLLNPTRTGVVPNYRFASTHWWDATSMYPGGTHGFLYAPPFALLFSPFNLLQPRVFGEILWRVFGFGLFSWGLWKLAGLNRTPRRGVPTDSPVGGVGKGSSSGLQFTFPCLVLLAVPASLASINNGQTNLPLSACLVLAALFLRDQKWGLSALLLSLCLVLKPIALAPWLLAFAVVPAMRTPLLVGVPVLVLAGFVHPSPSYAYGQWVEFFVKLGHTYTPENLRVSDLFGAVGKLDVAVPPMLEKGVRALACLGALTYVWRSFRRESMAGVSWAFWVASALVFTIFNPRVETNSYVLISPLLAFAAVGYWREVQGDRWKGVVLAIACIGLMCDGMGKTVYLATDVWFKPLIVLLVSPLLFRVPEGWAAENKVGTPR